MATLSKDYQPVVKDVNNVLVGVAQVRLGKPSTRAVSSWVNPTAQTVPTAVGQSTTFVDATDATTVIVVPTANTTNTGTIGTVTVTGTYTGRYDGTVIIRYSSTTLLEIYAPNGFKTTAAITTLTSVPLTVINLGTAAPSGLSVAAGVFGTAPAVGDTWVVPVFAAATTAWSRVQTGIVSPYSIFTGSADSVGGLKSSSFQPKFDSIKTLESGMPEEVVDRIVTKVSAQLKFDSLEYGNSAISALRVAVQDTINNGNLVSFPAEVVMRTRGNKLVTFWVPNCGITSAPTYAPTNDYSSLSWELECLNQCEIGAWVTGNANNLGTDYATCVQTEVAAYNAWLRNAPLFQELQYTH
jgi:hypothetical protein